MRVDIDQLWLYLFTVRWKRANCFFFRITHLRSGGWTCLGQQQQNPAAEATEGEQVEQRRTISFHRSCPTVAVRGTSATDGVAPLQLNAADDRANGNRIPRAFWQTDSRPTELTVPSVTSRDGTFSCRLLDLLVLTSSKWQTPSELCVLLDCKVFCLLRLINIHLYSPMNGRRTATQCINAVNLLTELNYSATIIVHI